MLASWKQGGGEPYEEAPITEIPFSEKVVVSAGQDPDEEDIHLIR